MCVCVGMCVYNGTSHNRLSEIRTASIQRTNYTPLIDFAIEIMHFQPLRPISRQWTESVLPIEQVAVQIYLQDLEWTKIKA